jgi:hypothetical protein
VNTARPAEEPADTPAAPLFFVWKIPGTAVRIEISLDVVRRIREYLTTVDPNSHEAGGLLLGDSRNRGAVITDFAPFVRGGESGPHFVLSEIEQTELRRRITELSRGNLESVIGYFRSDVRNGVCLYEQDQELIKRCFPDSSNVFLVVQSSSAQVQTAGFFFWEGGTIFSSFSFMEFEFDETILARQAHLKDTDTNAPAVLHLDAGSRADEERGSSRRLTEIPAHRRSASSTTSRQLAVPALIAVAAVIGIAAYLTASRSRSAQPSEVSRTRSDAARSLGLSVATSGSEINISWDAKAPLLKNARVALLTIQDGNARRDMPLTKSQLLSSRLVYTRATDTVQIGLEAFGEDGSVTRENVIAMSTASNPPVAQFESRVETVVPKTIETSETKRAVVRDFIAPRIRVGSAEPASAALPAAPPPDVASRVDLQHVGAPVTASRPVSIPDPAQRNPPSSTTATAAPQRMQLVSRAPQRAPVPVRQIRPVLPNNVKAMLTARSSIKVRVHIDANGRVTAVDPLATNGSLDQFLSAAASSAARLWVFEPARDGDRKVPSEITVEFTFLPENTTR